MFQPISRNLTELARFVILGFALAALYEPFRVSRRFVRTGAAAAGIEDFLYLAACGLVTFAYSLELGDGHFRAFYIIGEVFGGTVYFLTLGRLVAFVTKTFADAVKAAVKYTFGLIGRLVVTPVWKILVKIAQKVRKMFVSLYEFIKNRVFLLKSKVKMKYNISKVKLRKNGNETGEPKNTVRAKVRKAQTYTD